MERKLFLFSRPWLFFATPAPWEPQSGGATGQEAGGNGPQPEAPQDNIDPNDPRLMSESLAVDTTKDAYATPSLPPDAKYRAKLKHEGSKNDKGEVIPYATAMSRGTPPLPYFKTGISASIIDPSGRFDGFIVRPQFGGTIGTLVGKDHSSSISTVLARLRKPDGAPWVPTGMVNMPPFEWMQLLLKALAGEPEIGIETQWEWNCQKCGEELKPQGKFAVTIKGMNRFPAEQDPLKRKAGDLFNPEMLCQVNKGHGYYRGYPRIARFLSLEELKGATGK